MCLLAKLVERGRSDLSAIFANVVELAEEDLVLESAHSLEPGDPIGLSFYVPVAGEQSFVRISAGCEVADVEEEIKMLYRIRIQEIDEVSRGHVSAYVAGPRPGKGVPRA